MDKKLQNKKNIIPHLVIVFSELFLVILIDDFN